MVKFRVVRKDTKAPIQGAKIVLEQGLSDGITSAAGEAEIGTYYSGNLMYSVEAVGYNKVSGTVQVPIAGSITLAVDLGAFVQPPVPPPSGEEIEGSVGTSCDLMLKYMFGQRWHSYRNRYTGFHGSWDSESDDARYVAEKDPGCYAPPPPPPKSADDVQKDVDILRGTLQGISSRIQDLVTSITEMGKALVDMEARIKAWVIDSILDLIWSALTREKKVS